MASTVKKSFVQDLWDRRVIQYTFSYIVGSFGAIQFSEWLIKRFSLSPAWSDITLLFLVLLIPSVLLFFYHHGRDGWNGWKKVEKIVIPANLIFTLIILLFSFYGKMHKGMAAKVTVTDEEGKTTERIVPNVEYTTRLAIFPFTSNLTADDQWTSLATPYMLGKDMEQDSRIYTRPSYMLQNEFQKYGHEFTDEIPLSIQIKIAEDCYAQQFITGHIEKPDENFRVKVKVYSTKDGKEISSKEYEDKNLQNLVDVASNDFISSLYLPDFQQGEKTIDLPVSNLFSADTEAIKYYQEGVLGALIGTDMEKGMQAFDKAIKLDPAFTACYLDKGMAHYRMNQIKEGSENFEKAIEKVDALPERMQFWIKYNYYAYTQNGDKAIALLEMWRQLYPHNYEPYRYLQNYYGQRGEFDKIKTLGKSAMENGFKAETLIAFAYIESVQGNHEKAIEYYEQFIEAFPNRANETTRLAEIYIREGKYEKARAYYDKLLLLKPNDTNLIRNKANFEQNHGNPDEAIKLYEQAIAKAKSTKDSVRTYITMANYYQTFGQIAKVFEMKTKSNELSKSYLTDFERNKDLYYYSNLKNYVDIGQEDLAEQKIKQFKADYKSETIDLACVIDFNYGVAIEDINLLSSVMQNKACLEQLDKNLGERTASLLDGYYYKLTGEYDKSITAFQEFLSPTGIKQSYYDFVFGEIYHLKGEYDKAIDFYNSFQSQYPNDPENLYHMGLSYEAKGDQSTAKKCFEKSLGFWAKADPEYIPAKKVREKLSGM